MVIDKQELFDKLWDLPETEQEKVMEYVERMYNNWKEENSKLTQDEINELNQKKYGEYTRHEDIDLEAS